MKKHTVKLVCTLFFVSLSVVSNAALIVQEQEFSLESSDVGTANALPYTLPLDYVELLVELIDPTKAKIQNKEISFNTSGFDSTLGTLDSVEYSLASYWGFNTKLSSENSIGIGCALEVFGLCIVPRLDTGLATISGATAADVMTVLVSNSQSTLSTNIASATPAYLSCEDFDVFSDPFSSECSDSQNQTGIFNFNYTFDNSLSNFIDTDLSWDLSQRISLLAYTVTGADTWTSSNINNWVGRATVTYDYTPFDVSEPSTFLFPLIGLLTLGFLRKNKKAKEDTHF